MRKLILLILLLGSLFIFWDVYLAPHSLPYRTELTSKDGTSIEAVITQSDSKNVTFTSLRDNREYTLPVNELNLVSRYKALRLINKEPPVEASTPAPLSTNQNYIKNLGQLIRENERKIAALEVQKSQARLDHFGTGGSSPKERSIQRQIDRLIEENIRHHSRIKELTQHGN